jgi:dGTPase
MREDEINCEYCKLLKPDRCKESFYEREGPLQEFFSDRSRIIYSRPFRRLQRKAQVFSFESNTAVRTRLTHSLEVSDLGKRIAIDIADKLILDEKMCAGHKGEFVSVVENACLLHDIGNPPFGHFGEMAIRKWFSENKDNIIESLAVDQKSDMLGFMDDFLKYDGNCQGFRIATRLQWERDENGLNLTKPTIASVVKYPHSTAKQECHKAGFFQTEVKLLEKLPDLSEGFRFPLSFIMEAADDIAYCTSDISDSFEKEVMSPVEYLEALIDEFENDKECNEKIAKALWSLTKYKCRLKHQEKCENCIWNCEDKNECFRNPEQIPKGLPRVSKSVNAQIFYFGFLIPLVKGLTSEAVDEFVENHSTYLKGEVANVKEIFHEETNGDLILGFLKQVARKKFYRASEVEKNELTGYFLIKSILDSNLPLMLCDKETFLLLVESVDDPKVIQKKDKDLEWRLFNRLPKKCISYYRHHVLEKENVKSAEELLHRCHLIVDYISGMTDDFAVEMGKMYQGIM